VRSNKDKDIMIHTYRDWTHTSFIYNIFSQTKNY